MDILLTGGTGQVGSALRASPLPAGWTLHAPGRERLDLAEAATIRAVLAERTWAAVVNAGAYTAVDRAEAEVEQAWAVNAVAPAVLAAETARLGVPLVHLSTDYVFSGDLDRPYRESDAVGPINVYGASKEGGEQAVRTANPRHLIVRTAWIVSEHRSNFLKTMLALAETRQTIGVVGDQKGSPTSADDLARAIIALLGPVISGRDSARGTIHVTNGGEASWFDLAEHVFACAKANGLKSADVDVIGTQDYPTPARRPRNSRLSTVLAGELFGLTLRPWDQAVFDIVKSIAEGRKEIR
jgi:dTDP-4-dehydrorhamnose reductase